MGIVADVIPEAVTAPDPATVTAIPAALIYEVWNGKPVYYKGYREVLAGRKTPEEILSCSDLQAVVVSILHGHLFSIINRKKYLLATNESGLHLAVNNNLGNDIAIFDKAQVGKLKGKYFDVPPKVVIEVDIKADVADLPGQEADYLFEKSQKLLDFGIEKVVWVLTRSQKVFVASQGQRQWAVTNWDYDIPLIDDCILNIKRLLDDEEIEY